LGQNWQSEFRKWLGEERIGILTIDQHTDLRTFPLNRTYQILLTNYEKLPKLLPQLPRTAFDLLICDEGHRLKTQGNKAAVAMQTIVTRRRVLLTGTPIQNDLGEFWSMVDFVNPGLLESYATFRKNFEGPIVSARQPGVGRKVIELGRRRSEALSALTNMFVLRRTSEILTYYLPPKCPP
jgi:DNA repair and recombination protein RAD54B